MCLLPGRRGMLQTMASPPSLPPPVLPPELPPWLPPVLPEPPVSAGALAYIVYLSTLFGFAAWSWLLSLYPVSTVAPFTLLVPVFGFFGSAVLLGEPLQNWKLTASALVISGLCVNLFGPKLVSRS